MNGFRNQLINDAINNAYALTNMNIHNDFHKIFEFRRQAILSDESLTDIEKSEAIRILNANYDRDKIFFNEGNKRICENCQSQCLATSYCEHCIRNYLREKFSNWTSGDDDIDDLIQRCQMETVAPYRIIEWIPFSNLQNIEYVTKGGFSEIYEAMWLGGGYYNWDPKRKRLKRFGKENVILKKLNESASRSWFDEAKSHLIIGNKWSNIVQCFGLSQNPTTKDYFLVMDKMDDDLRKYLARNHNQLTWKKKIQINYDIIYAVYRIHGENAIHRDLHSGNILYLQHFDSWYISDLGICGPADKPLKSRYGNLPYMAPEVISGKEHTFASDIYSVAMLMWEISSGQPPFANFNYSDYDLAMNNINGGRPKIIPGTPLEYKNLMQQCWDADPLNRPDIVTVFSKIEEIYENYDQQTDNNINIDYLQTNTSSSSINSLVQSISKVHIFDDLPEPRNATEEEQEAYHSKLYDFEIPENIEDILSKQNDFIMLNDEKNGGRNKSKSKRSYSRNSNDEKQDLGKKLKKIKLKKNEDEDYEDYEDYENYNNPNFHSEDHDMFEIPEGEFEQ